MSARATLARLVAIEPARPCGVPHPEGGARCALLADHTNGRHWCRTLGYWSDPARLVRRARYTARRYTLHDSPLWTGEHSLWGRIVTDPREVALIHARVARGRRWFR